MGYAVYILCALTSLGCTVLLIGRYRKSGVDLLFWSALSFLLLTVANILLFVDLVLLGQSMDLSVYRNAVNFVAISVLLYGLIRNNT
jgi:hypothetical protein